MSFRGSAATVVARLFRLINPQGQVVGEFSPDIPVYHDPGLLLWHSSSHASMLAWSNPDTEPSNHTIYLSTPVGPTPVTSNALLVLEHNDVTNVDVATLHVGSVEGIRCTNDGVNSVTKLTGGSLEFVTTFGILLGVDQRAAYMLTAMLTDAATPGTQNVTLASVAVTGLTVQMLDCVAGDLIEVTTTLSVYRQALVDANTFVYGITGVTNTTTTIAGSLPVVRLTSLNDIIPETWTRTFTVIADGTCTVTVNIIGDGAANDYALLRDWCNILVKRFSIK